MARRLMDGVDTQDPGDVHRECLRRMFTKSLHRDSLPKITHCRLCWTILLDHARRPDRLMEQQQKLCTLPFSFLFALGSLFSFLLALHLAHQLVLHLALHLTLRLTLRLARSGCTRHFRLDSRLLNERHRSV